MKKIVSVHIPLNSYQELKEKADKKGVIVASLILELIAKHLSK